MIFLNFKKDLRHKVRLRKAINVGLPPVFKALVLSLMNFLERVTHYFSFFHHIQNPEREVLRVSHGVVIRRLQPVSADHYRRFEFVFDPSVPGEVADDPLVTEPLVISQELPGPLILRIPSIS